MSDFYFILMETDREQSEDILCSACAQEANEDGRRVEGPFTEETDGPIFCGWCGDFLPTTWTSFEVFRDHFKVDLDEVVEEGPRRDAIEYALDHDWDDLPPVIWGPIADGSFGIYTPQHLAENSTWAIERAGGDKPPAGEPKGAPSTLDVLLAGPSQDNSDLYWSAVEELEGMDFEDEAGNTWGFWVSQGDWWLYLKSLGAPPEK